MSGTVFSVWAPALVDRPKALSNVRGIAQRVRFGLFEKEANSARAPQSIGQPCFAEAACGSGCGGVWSAGQHGIAWHNQSSQSL